MDKIQAVVGQWADYYFEWDGMVEKGPGCLELCSLGSTLCLMVTQARCS